jgi:repressor LexA
MSVHPHASDLPPAQRRVYQRLLEHYSHHGELPDLSDFARQLQMHYVSLKQHLVALDKKGHLIFESRGRGRSPLLKLPAGLTGIPVLGSIPAGPVSEALPQADGFLPFGTLRNASFALRIHGDSMADLIQHVDVVIFEKRQLRRSGEICAVRIDESDVTLKYVDSLDRGNYRLRPHNPAYEPLDVAASNLIIEGVYLGLLRGSILPELLEAAD